MLNITKLSWLFYVGKNLMYSSQCNAIVLKWMEKNWKQFISQSILQKVKFHLIKIYYTFCLKWHAYLAHNTWLLEQLHLRWTTINPLYNAIHKMVRGTRRGNSRSNNPREKELIFWSTSIATCSNEFEKT